MSKRHKSRSSKPAIVRSAPVPATSTAPATSTTPRIFGLQISYWQLAVAFCALIFGIVGSPWLINYYNNLQATVNLDVQLIAQPLYDSFDSNGKVQQNTWGAYILIMNKSNIMAKPFTVHIILANPIIYSHSIPELDNVPPGVQTDVVYAGGGNTYQVLIANLQPKTGCIIKIRFVASDKVKDETLKMSNSSLLTKVFFGLFVKSIDITGEKVNPIFDGIILKTPQSNWDVP